MRPGLPLGAVLFAVLLASCGGRPGVTVRVADQIIPIVLASTTEGTACSTSHGDGFPPNVPLTKVSASTPLALRVEADQGATEIRGAIYDVGASPGGPIEEFTLPGRSGTYALQSVVAGHTYRVLVNVRWSFVVTHGEVTHLFDVRMESG